MVINAIKKKCERGTGSVCVCVWWVVAVLNGVVMESFNEEGTLAFVHRPEGGGNSKCESTPGL